MSHRGFLPGIWASSYHGNVPDHRLARPAPNNSLHPYRPITDKELRP